MISMQRSLSSPVCVHPAPPVPTTAANPSRPPTPSHDALVVTSQPRRHRSRSPVHSAPPPEPAGPASELTSDQPDNDHRVHDDNAVKQDSGTSVSKKPLVAQASTQPSAAPPNERTSTSSSTPHSALKDALNDTLKDTLKDDDSPRTLPQPLLGDVSQYTHNYVTVEDDGTTLQELAHLVRLSKYQERKRAHTRVRLQRSLISTALSARLTRCGETTQRNLADLFRSGDTHMFAKVYDAVQDVRNSCDATRRYALLEPDMEPLQSLGMASSETLDNPPSVAGSISNSPVTPFLADLDNSSREIILHFLAQIRTNPDYLASRLCALSVTELQALTVFHVGLDPIESVLPFGNTQSSGRGSTSAANKSSASAVERLLSFQRHDPLSALIYTCFANSAGPDSAEDKRRTQVWATACSRLIQAAPVEYENVLVAIVNVWSAMRDWSGRSSMEWFIMKVLKDGAFLLDRADDPQGNRFHDIGDWTTKDTIRIEEFYDQVLNELFDLLDDEDGTGIPEGVLELGNEILRHLQNIAPSKVDSTRHWFVYKWIFSNWLTAVLIHPENFGMMAEYNITEYGCQRILKNVALKARDLVNDMLVPHHLGQPVSTPLKIKKHIENLVGRFKPSRSPKTARLLPARSITSLRETAEVHPYLVVSPADLVTLVNVLFPERRPQSAHSSSARSAAPSISGFSAISQPISVATSRRDMDTTSILGMSVSPVRSETTSYEPLLEQALGTPQRYSPPFSDAPSRPPNSYEEDGPKLRAAIREMAQVLGADAVAGSCHPCAERWAVLFVSADGEKLSLQMTYDPDDDEDEEISSAASEDDELEEKSVLSKDYHQLRDSVLRLVEDFEIPRNIEDGDKNTTFSNRASRLKKYRSKNKIITPEKNISMNSRNPYRKREENTNDSGDHSVLIAMLTAASSQSGIQSDFVAAHMYWKTLQQLNALVSPSLRKNGFASLLNIFSRGPRDSLHQSASAIEEYDAWLIWLKQSQERHEGLIDTMMTRLKALRDKMWYVTEVRNSEVYVHARTLCSALKIMGVPRMPGSFQESRAQLARNPTLNFIHKAESQMLSLLAAREDQGGPNKLTDDQVEKTKKWLQQSNVKNLCAGEERIHRLCCEIDNCVARLVGDSVTANPVLWSSALYMRDRKTFDGPPRRGRDRESSYGADDAMSVISSEYNRRWTPSANRPSSVLRNMSMHNRSQISIDSGRHSLSRASTAALDMLDSREYHYGHSSPSIDSATTFFSPFNSTMSASSSATSRAQSPTGSRSGLPGLFSHPYQQSLPSTASLTQPDTTASSTETVQQQRLSEEKHRFLSDLRQTLLSLLLSDLGNFLYAYGSETDVWFNDLGQECLELRSAEHEVRGPATQEANTGPSRQRALEKKKSSINLREIGDSQVGQAIHRRDSPSVRNYSSTGANEKASASVSSSALKDTASFPYRKAYQRLLRMFSIHPNPYTKLNILYELEQLISASLSSGGRRSRLAPRNQPNSNDDQGASAKQEQGDKDRRPAIHAGPSASGLGIRSASDVETRSIAPINKGHQDSLRTVLQSLLRDIDIRPKTLFRDLQFISAFVPSSVLDLDRNDAYFDTVVAAMSLKKEVVSTMVEVADGIVAASRKSSTGSSYGMGSMGSMLDPMFTKSSLHDAARMLTIAAKENDPTAQRELGLLQLSNPELVARTTLPLSKPRDVFKQLPAMETSGSTRPGSSMRHHQGDRGARTGLGLVGSSSSMPGGGGSADPTGINGDVRSDPALMCVALHWMETAQEGGDELARNFMSQSREI
ncbi:hypothetical protein F5B22DRAFT_375608 [Xylaria bambusicola]|uniref:uncharacterized protein n=1 Tax=Xylaria bambusicola TaxID=326684 RepID=UPI0020079418|nr:uncharacterized protein F5B22DRAFT_375608 [Xylaria bambusicola]KAI0508988.1 hypothetical protein F5B22DRAFT_375608 [Xylaria bambusicola]